MKEGSSSLNAHSNSKDEVIGAVVPIILSLMDQDKKSTALKQLQGHMFVEAFQSKEVVGEWVLEGPNYGMLIDDGGVGDGDINKIDDGENMCYSVSCQFGRWHLNFFFNFNLCNFFSEIPKIV